MFFRYFFIFILCSSAACSQNTITGVVINGENNSSLPSASVFINNSSRGTISDNGGKFVITGIAETNFELVISYAGFTTVAVKITPENIHSSHTIKLFPRLTDLAEIKIMAPEKDGWKRWGEMFARSFIGTSDFASQCRIENPEVLRFFYDRLNRILKVYSHGNLIIHNKALGYIVRYQLEEFRYDAKQQVFHYFGYTGFDDMAPRSNHRELKWEKNRKEAYEGSLTHFMRTVYKGTSAEEGFEVKEKIRIESGDSMFDTIYRDGNMPKAIINNGVEYFPVNGPAKFAKSLTDFMGGTGSAISKENPKNIPAYIDLYSKEPVSLKRFSSFDPAAKQMNFYFANSLRVVYKNAKERSEYTRQGNSLAWGNRFQTSEMFLINDEPVVVQSNGLYIDPLNVIVSGYWGWCKIAETLPSDYEVEK